MNILFSILFIIAFVSFVIPFIFWMWTNIVKTEDLFGIMRLKVFLYTWLIAWTIFVIDLAAMILIII